MKRTLIAVLAVLLVTAGASGSVVAQEQSQESQDLDELVEVYNQNVEDAPGFVESQLAGERIEVVVESDDGTSYYHANLSEDARVQEYGEGAAADPTVRVTTDEQTLEAIRTAETPSDRAVEAYDNGNIDVEGVGAVKSVQITAVEVGVAVGRFLGLL